ncbi:MAG: hypothetical protein EP344_12740 [Bacteroidetes bacterium]|nr:MAG: hypothetical protein EP344_12740 [Bacteroidota bacterium]
MENNHKEREKNNILRSEKTKAMFARSVSFAKFPILLTLTASLLLTACHTAQRFVESGDYDGAIEYCVQRLRGKKNKKTELVQGLEFAFAKAQARDLNSARILATRDRPEYWERINNLHRAIRDRQNKIAPLLPLVSKDGYQAKFEFVDIGTLEAESREKAAEHLYTQAEDLLQQAENGDRLAARNAYQTLLDLERRYYRQYKDKDRMLRDAEYLGTTHILFEVENHSAALLPRQFEDRMLAMGSADLDSRWKAFYVNARPDLQVDYRVVFRIYQIDISPERISERRYVDTKEIQDGWDYERDVRGRIKKDTAGNEIKKPHMIEVRARVLETFQSKAARLTGALEVYDGNSNARLFTREMGTEILFEHYAATYKGDHRALSKASKRYLDNDPVPFPPDVDMIMQAADRLKPEIRDELRQNRTIL